MTQRAYTEGSRAFAMFVARYIDRSTHADSNSDREKYRRYVDLLTPIAKAFVTDRAMESVLLAQQCFGGHGYIQETGIEQVVRDTRISQIYEGTNGIQAMDLLGRKVVSDGGKTVIALIDDLRQTEVDQAYSANLNHAFDCWQETTQWLSAHSASDAELVGAVAVDYMNLSGLVFYGYLWSWMSSADHQVRGKSLLADFYFAKLLPQINSLHVSIQSGSASLAEPASDWF